MSILYTTGTRVQVHPATDIWMRGERYGEILAVHCRRGRVIYTIRTDYGSIVKVAQGNILESVGGVE